MHLGVGVRKSVCRSRRSYVGKAARRGKATEAGPRTAHRASAQTQRQPAVTETGLSVESDFWDKRNQMQNAECLAAAVKHEKREE